MSSEALKYDDDVTPLPRGQVTSTGFMSTVGIKAKAYLQLTKPRIVLLFVVTGAAAWFVQRGQIQMDSQFWALCLGLFLTAGSANAANQFWDRDIDAQMERTRVKRPLPQGLLSPREALGFSVVTGLLGVFGFWYFAGFWAGFWAFFTIAYYVGFYTMWLKRRTPQNIVIGGAAGATAPLIAWSAAAGVAPGIFAWALFGLIFFWTPPHFWALSLCIRDEYAGVQVPMLPVVKGDRYTRKQILFYTFPMLAAASAPIWLYPGWGIYSVGTTVLGLEFLRRSVVVFKAEGTAEAWRLFGYSILYLFLVFVLMVVDVAFQGPLGRMM